MLRFAAFTTCAALLALSGRARAEPTPSVRLKLVAKVAACVDERVLRDAVAARLGYQPFHDDAQSSVQVTIAPGEKGDQPEGTFIGQVERFDAGGHSLGLRKFSSPTCAQLAPSIELALAIAIDPLSLTRPAPVPVPAPAPQPAAPPPAPAAPVAALPPSPPLGISVDVGGLGAVAIDPDVTGGITVGAELRWPTFSVGIEGQDDLPTTTAVTAAVGGGSVQVSSVYASVVPCLRLRYFGACAIAAGGAWQIDGVNHAAAPFAALGARALGELPLVGPLSLRLTVDLLAPIVHETVLAGTETLWTTPALAGEAALLLAIRLR